MRLTQPMTRALLALVLTLLAVGLAACGGSDGTGAPAPTSTAPAPVTTTTTTPPPPVTTTTPPVTTVTTSTARTTVPTTVPPPVTAPPTTSPAPARVISRGDPARRTVALTFDAGSDVGYTREILDVLAQSGIRATFGVTGKWSEAHPDLVARIAAAGHLLINHSYGHQSFTGTSARPALLTLAERRADVERADEIIQRITGHTTKPWFRSPYGDYDASVNAALGSLGYRYNVLWTVDSLGWQGASPSTSVNRTVGGAVPGAILLFHVGSQSQDGTALPTVIAGLRQAGYSFGTVADIVT
jgi:peptidoglycan/xylan/chitin deacetylase (PgdA/CDA1 family)